MLIRIPNMMMRENPLKPGVDNLYSYVKIGRIDIQRIGKVFIFTDPLNAQFDALVFDSENEIIELIESREEW